MAPRATWKGFLNLSLVSVPVKAYSANDSGGTIRMNQLHEECHARIKYKVECPNCGEISRKETIKGYEYAKDQFVIIDLDELDKLRAKDESHAIRIENFTTAGQVDPLHFSETSYYLLPDGTVGEKPFALLQSALERKNLVCVARVVLHKKDQLVMIRALDKIMCMTVLRYESEIKGLDLFEEEFTGGEVTDDEFKLAETLIKETTVDTFSISDYSDTYHERLTELINSKVEGKEIVTPEVVEEEAPVTSLMDALKASVERVRGEVGKPAKKKVPVGAGVALKKVAKSVAKPKKKAKKKKAAKKKTTKATKATKTTKAKKKPKPR